MRTDGVSLASGVITDDIGLHEDDVEPYTADSVGTSCEDVATDGFGFFWNALIDGRGLCTDITGDEVVVDGRPTTDETANDV